MDEARCPVVTASAGYGDPYRELCGLPLVPVDGPCVGGIWSDRVLMGGCGAERETAIHEVLYEFGGHPYQPPSACPIHGPNPAPLSGHIEGTNP